MKIVTLQLTSFIVAYDANFFLLLFQFVFVVSLALSTHQCATLSAVMLCKKRKMNFCQTFLKTYIELISHSSIDGSEFALLTDWAHSEVLVRNPNRCSFPFRPATVLFLLGFITYNNEYEETLKNMFFDHGFVITFLLSHFGEFKMFNYSMMDTLNNIEE